MPSTALLFMFSVGILSSTLKPDQTRAFVKKISLTHVSWLLFGLHNAFLLTSKTYNGNKLLFATAQNGQAFRNEISLRQGLLWVRVTTYAYLPEATFVEYKHVIMTELRGVHQIKSPDPSYNDICFAGAGWYCLPVDELGAINSL